MKALVVPRQINCITIDKCWPIFFRRIEIFNSNILKLVLYVYVFIIHHFIIYSIGNCYLVYLGSGFFRWVNPAGYGIKTKG